MSDHQKQFIDILKYMYAICHVRGNELKELLPNLAEKALDAGYWSEAFRVFLYDGDATISDIQVTLESHIEQLGGTVKRDQESADLIEVTYYLRKLVQPGEDALDIAHYLFVELNDEWVIDGGPAHLHLHDLAMEYYAWCYDYAEWMQGLEYGDKMYETEINIKKLTLEWLEKYAVPNPFDRL